MCTANEDIRIHTDGKIFDFFVFFFSEKCRRTHKRKWIPFLRRRSCSHYKHPSVEIVRYGKNNNNKKRLNKTASCIKSHGLSVRDAVGITEEIFNYSLVTRSRLARFPLTTTGRISIRSPAML